MSKTLNNNTKFKMCQFDHNKEINYILSLEKKLSMFWKILITEKRLMTDYWCPSLRPIFSAITHQLYKLAKFLVPLLTPLTSNDYTIKDSFSFAEGEVSTFDCAHYVTSFDVESLFTNISLVETINICVYKFFQNNAKVNLTKELATLDSFFQFWW